MKIELNNSDQKKWYLLVIAGIFILGISLRIMVFLYNRPLWLDECQLALSILERNIFGFFSALEFFQSAPPLFMMTLKLFSKVFGIKEFALRLFPLLCGLIAIPVFYKFSKMFLIRKWSVVLASFLFAVNCELIYYSEEVKQYSSDVLFFMLTFLALNKLSLKNLSIPKIILYSVGISILPLFSIPTCFLIGGWFVRELISSKFKCIKKIIIFLIPVVIVNILYYIYVINPQYSLLINRFEQFWSQGFINFDLLNNFDILKQNIIFFFSSEDFTLLKIGLLMLGLYFVFRRIKSLRNILLITSFIFMCMASYFHIYPLSQRVALYTLPLLIVFIIKPFDYLSVKKKWYSLIISIVFLCAFWNPLHLIKFDNYNPSKIHSQANNARTLMQNLIKYYNGNACVIVKGASLPEYFYYTKYYNFSPECLIIYNSKSDYKTQLDNLQNGEYWFYHSFDYPDRPIIPLTKKWAADYEIIYEYETKDTYLLNMRKSYSN